MELYPARARILVATPDWFLLTEYCAALRKEGLDADISTTGVECVEQLERAVPSLVVLDADLLWGGADGVLAILGDDPGLPAVPTMIISSENSRSALYQVAQYLVADYQLKPVSGKRLAQRVRFLLTSRLLPCGISNEIPDRRPSAASRTV